MESMSAWGFEEQNSAGYSTISDQALIGGRIQVFMVRDRLNYIINNLGIKKPIDWLWLDLSLISYLNYNTFYSRLQLLPGWKSELKNESNVKQCYFQPYKYTANNSMFQSVQILYATEFK